MFVPLKNLISIALSRKGIEKEASAAHVCEAFRKVAAELIHPLALEHIYPKYFRHGVLTIGVDHPAWAQQVREKQLEIIGELKSRLRGIQVTRLRTLVSPPKTDDFAPDLEENLPN